MIRPYFFGTIVARARRVAQKAEAQFQSNAFCQASSLRESIIAQPSEPPAALTRMSMVP